MNEAEFIRKIRKKLPPEVFSWKTHTSMQGGVPDCYYEGEKGTVWVEYKFVARPVIRQRKSGVTPLQLAWLSRLYQNGCPAWLVMGTPFEFLYGRFGPPYDSPIVPRDRVSIEKFINTLCQVTIGGFNNV